MNRLRPRPRKQGFALVLTLSVVLIISLLVVILLSKSQLGAASSTSFSNSTKASALGQDALSVIVGSLQAEIFDSNNSTVAVSGSTTLYLPKLASNFIPAIDDTSASDSTVLSLLKSSRTTGAGFTATANYLAPLASNITTDIPSLNGRYVPLTRWNDPQLLTTIQNNAQPSCPNWVYVNRNGPVALTTYNSTLAKSSTGGTNNLQFVVGRFAYRVYDISGLLDLNVAGFPEVAASTNENGRKGTLAWLNFQDPSIATMGINSQATTLFDWRGPSANYTNYADDFGRQYGFMVAPLASGYADPVTGTSPTFPNANRFLSRNDLIQYTYAPANSGQFAAVSGGSAPTPEPESFLTQAGMFTREVNAPSWGPDPSTVGKTTFVASPVNLNPVSSDSSTVPASIADTRVVTAFTRWDKTNAAVGDPLVKTRFPLSEIDQLSNPTAANAAEIMRYFGLTYQNDGTWKYGHPTDGPNLTVLDPTLVAFQTSTTLSNTNYTIADPSTGERLHTLAELTGGGTFPVQTPREPDFFELLQAGIQPDSLGQGVADDCDSGTYGGYLFTAGRDQNIARHVLQIGVNIIDQWGSGNDPTVIRRTPITSYDAKAAADPDISGIKNLPYIQMIGRTSFRRFDVTEKGPSGSTNYPNVTSFYQFQLWNPHQNAASAPAGTFRIVANGQVALHMSNPDNTGSGVTHDLVGPTITYTASGSTPDSIGFTQASDPSGHKFAEPAMLLASSTGITVSSSNDEYVSSNGASIVGFWQGNMVADYDGFTPKSNASTLPVTQRSYYERFGALSTGSVAWSPPITDQYAQVNFVTNVLTTISSAAGLTFQLQKQDANGNWRPVQTIPAIVNNRHELSDSFTTFNNVNTTNDTDEVDTHPVCVDALSYFPDPRTIRFGAFTISNGATTGTTSVSMAATRGLVFMGWLPENLGAQTGTASLTLQALQLYQNSPTSTSNYTDRGLKVTRLGDSSVSPYTTGSTARPIMLNRRFHSLAEFGYVFRDLPWKSLNFSRDDSSASTTSPKPTADGGLLDLFSLTEAPVRAGVVNLNAAPAPVLTALLTGTALAPGSLASDPTALSSTDVTSVITALQNYVGTRASPSGNTIRTAADIALALQADPVVSTWPKLKMEAAVAALGDVHNARTWNLLIDVVTQTGRFPAQVPVTSLANFSVTGQKHTLLQLAIDRYTGKVVDEILEPSMDADLSTASTP